MILVTRPSAPAVGRASGEAQAVHVVADGHTVGLIAAVASTGDELGSLLLPPQDGDAVYAASGATLALKHGPAEAVVVVERRGAQGVRFADPLRQATAHDGVVQRRLLHVRPTHLHPLLRLFAIRVSTLTRHEVLSLVGGRESDECVLTMLRAHRVRRTAMSVLMLLLLKRWGAVQHVILQRSPAPGAKRALEPRVFARGRRRHGGLHGGGRGGGSGDGRGAQ